MTKNRGLLLSSVATAGFLALSCGAMAADIPEEIPPEATWTGFHIGVGGGYGTILHDGSFDVEGEVEDGDDTDDFENFLTFDDLGDEAGLGTVEAGFDFQFDQFVLGIFGDYTFTNFQATGEDLLCDDAGAVDCVGKRIELETDDMWSVGGRFGFLSSERTLWYGLAAYTQAKVDAKGTLGIIDNEDVDPLQTVKIFDDDDRVDGLTVGAGVESMLTDNISLKLEYRYTAFKDFNQSLNCEDAAEEDNCTLEFEDIEGIGEAEVEAFDADFDSSMQSIRAVVSYRFNPL